MKWTWTLGIIIWLFAALGSTPVHAVSEDFVRAQGTKLVHGAQNTPYYYVGTHIWYAPLLGCANSMGDRERLRTELDSMQAVGIRNIRVLAGVKWHRSADKAHSLSYEWDTNETDTKLLRGLDYLMAEAGKREMLVTVCLTPEWKHDEEWRKRYTEYILKLVSRTNSITKIPYREDVSLLAWQLCDEAFVEDTTEDEAFAAWVRESAALIKVTDKNHLVSVGLEGAGACHGDMGLYQRVMSDDNIDFLTIQLKPIEWNWGSNDRLFDALPNVFLRTNEYLDVYDRLAHKLDKPYIIDAFSYPRDGLFTLPGTVTDARNAFFSYIFSKLNDSQRSGAPLAGVNWIGWGGLGHKLEEGEKYSPQNYLAEYPHQPQGVYSVYNTDSLTLQIVSTATRP